jgi:hypothetical protein
MSKPIPFAASAVGSFWWEGALLLKKALARQGIDLAIDDRTSNVSNVLSIAKGDSLLGITTPQFVDWAERRLGAFAGLELPELRVVAALNLPMWLAAAVDRSTGFTELTDIARARFPWKVVLPHGGNLVGMYIDRILKEHGAARESIISWGGADSSPMIQRSAAERAARELTTEPASMNMQTAALAKSGGANGFFLYINPVSEWARDLTTLRDMRFLRFDEAILDSINADWGATKITLPARLFNGVDEDLPVAGWRHHYIYGKADVPDDVVRAVLTALEDERILDNAQSFSYSALRPNLVRGVRLHRVTEERFAR